MCHYSFFLLLTEEPSYISANLQAVSPILKSSIILILSLNYYSLALWYYNDVPTNNCLSRRAGKFNTAYLLYFFWP